VPTLSVIRIGILLSLAAILVYCGMAAAEDTPTAQPSASAVQTVSSANPADVELPTPEQQEVEPAEPFLLPTEHHPWTRFPVGAWREVQITTETFDEAGLAVSKSITTQEEKLQSISDDRYALNVQATVDLVGKRITGKWISRVLYTATDGAGQVVESRRLEDQSLALTNGLVACQVWDVLYRDDARTLVDRLYYSPQQYPHVLRRETSEVASDENETSSTEQQVVIVAVDIPYVVDEETIRCTCLQTTRQGEKGSTVKISMVSELVPGGEVAVWATDFDPQGRRSRWSSQELVSFGQAPPVGPPPTRRELRRARRRNQ